jgi:nucleoside-diphosphate-sugar epimerase
LARVTTYSIDYERDVEEVASQANKALNERGVLVTGATGAVGPAVVAALIASGYSVRALVRSSHGRDALPPSVDVVTGAIDDPVCVRTAMNGIAVVHHLAGLAHVVRPRPGDRERFEQTNVGGTRVVAEAAAVEGVRRVVFYSTIAVYGATSQPEILDESSPLYPVGPYATSKAKAEEVIGRVLGSRCTVLRLAAVFGPRMKGNYQTLVRAVSSGRFLVIGSLRNRRTLVCADDVGAVAALVSGQLDVGGQVLNVTDGEIYTLGEIVDAIASAADRSLPSWHVPVAPVRAVGIFVDVARAFGLPLPPVNALLDKYVEDVAVRGDRLQSLGFRPSCSLVECARKALESTASQLTRSSRPRETQR